MASNPETEIMNDKEMGISGYDSISGMSINKTKSKERFKDGLPSFKMFVYRFSNQILQDLCCRKQNRSNLFRMLLATPECRKLKQFREIMGRHDERE